MQLSCIRCSIAGQVVTYLIIGDGIKDLANLSWMVDCLVDGMRACQAIHCKYILHGIHSELVLL